MKKIILFLLLLFMPFNVHALDIDTDDNNTVDLEYGGSNKSFSDPNDDRMWFWNDTDGEMVWLDFGDGFTFNDTTVDTFEFDSDYLDADSANSKMKVGSETVPSLTRNDVAEKSITSTLTTAEVSGTTIYATAAITLTLPDLLGYEKVTIIADGANTITITCDSSDDINLDGTASSDGTIASDGSDGAAISLIYRDSDTWWAASDGLWTD